MVLFLAALISGSVIAQDATGGYAGDLREKASLGLKAGVNVATIYDTKGEDFSTNAKLGFAGGLFLSIPIGRVIGIQPEVLYSRKGFSGSGNITVASYKYVRTADYLDVPLMLQLKPGEHMTIVAGPFFSFLLNKRLNIKDGSITVEQQTQLEDYNIRKNVFGLTGGVDLIAYPLVISGRVGFDLQHNNGDGTSTDPRYKNAWIQGTIGFMF